MKWYQPVATGAFPPPRYSHASAQLGSKLYVFGGFSRGTALNDLFVLDTDTFFWVEPVTTGKKPSPRFGHSACCVGKKLYVFGGCSGPEARFNDLYCFDTETLEWSKPEIRGTAPSPRFGHTASACGHQIYVFGGRDARGLCNDVAVLDVGLMQWLRPPVTGTAPLPRVQHTTLLFNNQLVVFGGVGPSDERLSDVAVLDLDSMRWMQTAPFGATPRPRDSHVAVVVGSALLVVGGFDGRNRLADLCVLDLATLRWSSLDVGGAPPSARFGAVAAALGSRVVLFGGRDASGWLADVCVLDTGGAGGIPTDRITVGTQTAYADAQSLRSTAGPPPVPVPNLSDLLQKTMTLRESMLGPARGASELAASLRREQVHKVAHQAAMQVMPSEDALFDLQRVLSQVQSQAAMQGEASPALLTEAEQKVATIQASLESVVVTLRQRHHHITKVLGVLPEPGSVPASPVPLASALSDYESWENQASFAVGAAIARTNAALRELALALDAERQLLLDHSENLQQGHMLALTLAGCSTALSHELRSELQRHEEEHAAALSAQLAGVSLELQQQRSLIEKRYELRQRGMQLQQQKVGLQKKIIEANAALELHRVEGAPQSRIAELEADVAALRTQLHELEAERESLAPQLRELGLVLPATPLPTPPATPARNAFSSVGTPLSPLPRPGSPYVGPRSPSFAAGMPASPSPALLASSSSLALSGAAVSGLPVDTRRMADYQYEKLLAHHKNRKIILARRIGKPCVLRELNVASRPEFEARLRYLASLQHPALIPLEALFFDGLMAHVQTPYYADGNLAAWLRRTPPLTRPSLEQVLSAFARITHALWFLHSEGVLHGALHFGNVLMGNDGPVLADFGLVSETPAVVNKTDLYDPSSTQAPEVAEGKEPSAAADVWALGALLHIAVFGAKPGDTIPSHPNELLRDFLASALVREPRLRPTAAQLVLHPLLLANGAAQRPPAVVPDCVRQINQHPTIVEADGALVTAAATLNRTRMHALYSSVPARELRVNADSSYMEQLLDAVAALPPDGSYAPVLVVGAVGPTTAAPTMSDAAARDCGAAAAASQALLARVAAALVTESDLFVCVADTDPFAKHRLYVPAARAAPERLAAAGRLLAHCVAEGVPLALPLAPAVLRSLASPHASPATLRDLELVSPNEALRARRVAALGELTRADLAVRDVVDIGRSAALAALASGFQRVPPAATLAQSLSSAQLAVFLGAAVPPTLPSARLRCTGFDGGSRAPDLVRAMVDSLSPLCVRRLCVAVAGTAFLPANSGDVPVLARTGTVAAAPATVGPGLVLPDTNDERALAQALADVLISVDSA